jgi:TM2 domain-containing membrane protein YozV
MRKSVFRCLFLLIWCGFLSVQSQAAINTLVRAGMLQNKSLPVLKSGLLKSPLGSDYLSADVDPADDDFFQMPGEFEEKEKGLKSAGKAALFSLLLPGAGEVYAGAETKGKIFIISEASLWAGFLGLKTYSTWLKDDYKSYAAEHAEVNLNNKTDDFFDELAFYENRDQYNQFGPLYNPGEKLPYPENDLWNWQWDSRESRLHYRDLKNRSKGMSRKALYMVGLSIVNRIVSVVDALKTVKSYNRKKSLELSQLKFDLKANPLGHDPSVMFYVSHRW